MPHIVHLCPHWWPILDWNAHTNHSSPSVNLLAVYITSYYCIMSSRLLCVHVCGTVHNVMIDQMYTYMYGITSNVYGWLNSCYAICQLW